MSVVCTQPFKACTEDHPVFPVSFDVGDPLTGVAADIAMRNGWGAHVDAVPPAAPSNVAPADAAHADVAPAVPDAKPRRKSKAADASSDAAPDQGALLA